MSATVNLQDPLLQSERSPYGTVCYASAKRTISCGLLLFDKCFSAFNITVQLFVGSPTA